MRTMLLAAAFALAGCATTSDMAPPATAVKVSTPCAALNDIDAPPAITPTETFKTLGAACKAGDDRSCGRVVYLINLDRQRLADWMVQAVIGIESCKKE